MNELTQAIADATINQTLLQAKWKELYPCVPLLPQDKQKEDLKRICRIYGLWVSIFVPILRALTWYSKQNA